MKMVHEFCKAGHQATLVVPRKSSEQEEGVDDVFTFYGVDPFPIVYIPWKAFPGSKYLYSFFLACWIWLKRPALVYTRDFYPALHVALLGIPVVMEFHSPPLWGKGPYKSLAKRFYRSKSLKKLVVISEALRRIFTKQGIEETRLLVAHDGSDPAPEAQEPFPLQGTFKVGYVGHLYAGRGIKLIEGLARSLPGLDFHLAGGREKDVARWKSQTSELKNIHFHGFLPPSQTHAFRASCDVFLAPYQKKVIISDGKRDSSAYMSPLKIFEYMASGKAIISSDLPVLREVLDESIAVLCDPEKPEEWVDALKALLANPEFLKRLGHQAKEKFLTQYTWEKRASCVLNSIND